MKTPRWKKSPWGRRSRPIHQGRARGDRASRRRRFKTHSFVGERGTNRVLTQNETPECGTLPDCRADRATKGWRDSTRGRPEKMLPRAQLQEFLHSRLGCENQTRKGWPHPEGIPNSYPKRTSFRSSGKKDHTRPVGWPHREVIKDRWTEQAFVPIECVEIRNMTRQGWPHREGSAPKHQGRCEKSLHSDRGLRKTRPVRVTSSRRLGAIYRSREPEGTLLHKARRRANGRSRGTHPWFNQLARYHHETADNRAETQQHRPAEDCPWSRGQR